MFQKTQTFDDVISQLCKKRKCVVLEASPNDVTIQSPETTFWSDVVYFETVCDCFMATMYGTSAWIICVSPDRHTIRLGCNY